ncbi:MAG: ABC transporter permease [Chloroflexi bacterium]|nr:ABC transporter permease [Chloroflexota bacterium]
MSATPGTVQEIAAADRGASTLRRRLTDQPVIPLLFLLLCLVVLLFVIQPGFLGRPTNWLSSTIRTATPLALLAACQTLVMLTGGIDLSVATIATMSAFVMATQSAGQGDAVAVLLGILVGACMGLINGIGIGIFRVQPLIMTLGTGLVGAGALTVYQKFVLTAGSSVPDPIAWLGGGTSLGFFPNCLLLFVPVAALIIFGLRRTGYGRMLFAVGDNPVAARLAGVRIWQVLMVLYVISGVLAAVAGIMLAGVTKTAALGSAEGLLLPSVAAAVIGGTSIFGGRGGYAGSIVGALILTVLTSMLTVLSAPQPVRQIIFGAIILTVAAAYARLTASR